MGGLVTESMYFSQLSGKRSGVSGSTSVILVRLI
jgi:hypothetical protein